MSKKTEATKKDVPVIAGIQNPHDMEIIMQAAEKLKLFDGNARTHSEKQITALMASIKRFGFRVPIVTNDEGVVLAGHGRLEAARRLGLSEIPTVIAAGLTKTEQRAYNVTDNKIGLMSDWDDDLLVEQIELLIEDDFEIEITGFSTAEIDLILDDSPTTSPNDPEDLQLEDTVGQIVSKPGDLWQLGNHKLYCGDALEKASYECVMSGEQAEMVSTDPPYNVKIDGHVCGSGAVQHDEFLMAAGEMDRGEFTSFLAKAFSTTKPFLRDGAIVFSFMDWRHMREILDAGEAVFDSLRQLCVWSKDNGGMGTFYRSRHELVFVFRKGSGAHINNFGLGQHGRYRTNVWDYPGVNKPGSNGHELLKLHPTVKPVSLIADMIRDCSHRNGIVLDPFAGSGTILIAAERTGRQARAIELDPKYVDVAIRRWERVTGESAIHAQSGATFCELADSKAAEMEGR